MTILNEFESKKLLTEFGIKVPKGEIANIINLTDDIYGILGRINSKYYVLKIVSDDIPHKSDVGGVILNVSTNEIFTASSKMIKDISNKLPQVKLDGIYIQEQVPIGIECIIGIKEDIQFGKVIIFGFGGIYTEIFKDISMRILPITKKDVEEMISETKVSKILFGVRGKTYDIEGIIDVLIKISNMANNLDIEELDLNPITIHEQSYIVLDARIKLKSLSHDIKER